MILFVASGLLLLAAAVKGYFLTLEAGGDITQEQAQGLWLVVAESTLGLWLLSGWKDRLAHDVGILWFAACFCWSVGHWLAGTASCGCAGRIEIPPLYSGGVVLMLLLGLIVVRPAATGAPSDDAGSLSGRRALCAVAQSFVLIYLVAFLVLGSPRWVLAYFEAAPLVIVPSRIEVGLCKFGDDRVVELTIKNITTRMIRIQSVQTTCECTTLADPPQQLEPGEVVTLNLKVRCVGLPDSPFHQTIRFYAVDGGLHTILIDVFASLTGSFTQPGKAE